MMESSRERDYRRWILLDILNTLSALLTLILFCVPAMAQEVNDPNSSGQEGRSGGEQAKRMLAAQDRHRPLYHATPPVYTMGDPNGLVQYKGVYHLFYQHVPFSGPEPRIHWGHLASTDLIHWNERPIALYPDPMWTHCASGSVVINKGVPTAIFTGVGPVYPEVPCIATAKDDQLNSWTQYEQNPVIKERPKGMPGGGFRDPYVWREGNLWFMGLASSIPDAGGAVLLYSSPDLRNWEYVGKLYQGKQDPGAQGELFECPSFFPLGDKYFLSFNKLFSMGDPPKIANARRPIYMIGSYANHQFVPEFQEDLDLFNESWAPQAFRDERGRHILFILSWCGRTDDAGWIGTQTMPRQITSGQDHRPRFHPVDEVLALRRGHQHYGEMKLNPASRDVFKGGLKGDCKEVRVVFEPGGDAKRFGVLVRMSPDGKEYTKLYYDVEQRRVIADRRHASPAGAVHENPRDERGGVNLPVDQPLVLDIFLDKSVIEVFVNDGMAAGITRVYPSPGSLGIDLFAEGGSVTIRSVDAWEMMP